MQKAAAGVPGQRRGRGQGRGPSTETVVRHWTLMKALPTEPRFATVKQLFAALKDDRVVVAQRTVERDLVKLEAVPGLPLTCQNIDGVNQWAWMENGQSQIMPKPSLGEATLLVLAQRYLEPLLSPVLRQALQPTFTAAKRALEVAHGRRPSRWSAKIGAVPPLRPLDAPPVLWHRPPKVVEALLEDRKVRLSYRLSDRIESFTVNPHALVQRGLATYLIATCDPHRDLRALALHRMGLSRVLTTQKLDQPAVRVPGFDLEAYIAAGFEEFQ